MKLKSVKFKITCWYTVIILLIFLLVLGGAFFYSEYYSIESIKTELEDEVKDFQDNMLRFPGQFPKDDFASFYDDGVMLSIYDADHNFLDGVRPNGLPDDIAFSDGQLREITVGEDNWFLNDKMVTLPDDTVIWIRGIHSFSTIMLMVHRLTLLLCILFPALVLITAFVSYRMIQRSLDPIHTITQTANEITASSDLSLRLPMPKAQDEFYELSQTFNKMFETLEQHFLRERQFSSDAAHELRTPVSIILSRCEYCMEEQELSPEAMEELKAIRQKALQMSNLVSQLLAISRAENRPYQPDFEEVDLEILAESVVEELEERASEKDIRMEIVNHLDSPFIRADMSLLTRMFMNLADNAISYNREHGYVKIFLESSGPQVCLRFEDNGIGIPEESLGKIWDRFYRADSSRSCSSGFGLGLYMVKYIVNCHKGKISVTSTPGEGSVFTVLLPKNPFEAGL